ncbi:MAG: hypothetical protein N0C88_01990 [Candidatus Thiodiazotropha lotti]|uniref:Uncharacterized protein n=2 Tax=Candidatus Thiodiazotropha TaxID=1913444 RepID=A0A9E4K245_9GAMM|nr:hypothetical protein [Candidatus Thiodiazotropha lotti]MCW4202080.1 hypothetical protein [Candidatus Thiodiazotropha lotti]
MKRRPYFVSFLIVLVTAIIGGYVLRVLLLREESLSPWYLEITYAWGLLVAGILTPLALRRIRDIGISKWWVVLIWLPAILNLKFWFILSEYTDTEVSSDVFESSTVIALVSVIFLSVLLFKSSEDESDT